MSGERKTDYSYRDQQWRDERSRSKGSIFWDIQFFLEMGMTASETALAKQLTDGVEFDPVKFSIPRIQNAITKASRRGLSLTRQKDERAATRTDVARGEFAPQVLAQRVGLWLNSAAILLCTENPVPSNPQEWKEVMGKLSAEAVITGTPFEWWTLRRLYQRYVRPFPGSWAGMDLSREREFTQDVRRQEELVLSTLLNGNLSTSLWERSFLMEIYQARVMKTNSLYERNQEIERRFKFYEEHDPQILERMSTQFNIISLKTPPQAEQQPLRGFVEHSELKRGEV